MTDDPRTPDDDLIRDALRAEAAGVHADADLLARIRTAAAPPPAWRRRTPLLAVAAAVVVVTGLAAVLLARDDDTVVLEHPELPEVASGDLRERLATLDRCQDLDGAAPPVVRVLVLVEPADDPDGAEARAAVEAHLASFGVSPARIHPAQLRTALIEADLVDPSSETLSTAATPFAYAFSVDTPGAATELVAALSDLPGVWVTSVTDCRDGSDRPATTETAVDPGPPEGDRPTVVALVREDGWLVLIDLETGEERELHSVGDPRDTSKEGGPYYIDSVDLSPDGEWIYYSTCCEPADGMTYRIPSSGGPVEYVSHGAYPRMSPDGRHVATAGSVYLYVQAVDDDADQPLTIEVGCCARHLAWSPDGSELALVHSTGAAGETPQVRRFTWDGTTLAEGDMGKPDNPGWFVMWMPDGMPVTSQGDPIADDRGRSQDGSYQWILWVDEEGVVKEQAGFQSGDVTPIPGLPRALAADW